MGDGVFGLIGVITTVESVLPYLTSLDGALASARELRPLPSRETSGKEGTVGAWTFIVSTGPVGSRARRNLDRRAFTGALKFLFADHPAHIRRFRGVSVTGHVD
jgi:hypothetical protein